MVLRLDKNGERRSEKKSSARQSGIPAQKSTFRIVDSLTVSLIPSSSGCFRRMARLIQYRLIRRGNCNIDKSGTGG